MHHDVSGLRSTPARVPGARPSAPYRTDLDGLRGLAIALVVVFHIWLGRVSGGVDVFLVLSGFFFTTMVVRRVEGGGPRAVGRIAARTARRLFPAYIVVLAAVAAWTVYSSPYTVWENVSGQLLASLGYVQNWELARTASDYAAADASVSSLQHLWSMSVQMQFYIGIVVAVLALSVLGSRRLLIGVLAMVTVLSFVYAAHTSATQQGWAYYDTGARLWQLTAGGLLGLTIHRLVLPFFTRRALGVLGLIALLSCGLILDGAASFPGPAALFPVGAAVALILAGAGGPTPGVSRLLSTRPLLFLGESAYPLYLWHWPVLIFSLDFTDSPTVGLVDGLIVVAISVAATMATRVLVEKPMLRPSGSPRTLVTALGTALVVLVASTLTWQAYLASPATDERAPDQLDSARYPGALALTDGLPVPDAPMRPTVFEAEQDLPRTSFEGCITDMNSPDVVRCEYGDPAGTRTLALVGGSHAEHWITAVDAIGQQRGLRVVTFLKMGCPLDIGEPMLFETPNPNCASWSRDVLDRLDVERPDWIITNSTRPSPTEFGDITPQAYVDVWERFEEMGLNVIALRDTPWLSVEGVPYRAIDCLADGGDADGCGMPRSEVLAPVDPGFLASIPYRSVVPVDLSDAVCGPDLCSVVVGNVLVYHDSHHLSASYVRTLVPALDQAIGDVTRWW